MIQQLVKRIVTATGLTPLQAATNVLTADPLDVMLHVEQVWSAWSPPAVPPPPLQAPAREALTPLGQFGTVAPPTPAQAWDHLGYSYVLENTRAVQIFRRVVREFRAGEGIGIASPATKRWLDATEALLFGALDPGAALLSTGIAGRDGEATRRNAYWRLFGLDLAFGSDDNRPPVYDKANATNSSFISIFEELLSELWQAILNLKNLVGANATDDDRIFRLAEALQLLLLSRRQERTLAREELIAATMLGWIELTLSSDTLVIEDTGTQATNPANRLANLGAKVNLAPHSKSSALFSMSAELSQFLRTIESGQVSGPGLAWILYRETAGAIGRDTRRVITEWAAATGKDLKARGGKSGEPGRPRLVAVA